jgi:hypothetical protein
MARLVKVTMWELTDQELDDQAAQCEATAPDDAAEFRRVKAWRQDHPAQPLIDPRGRDFWCCAPDGDVQPCHEAS